jgi:predicted nucleotidyltransferase component of viral defense system
MLDFEQVKKQYPPQLQGFERAILREYLQYKILQAIFESKQASQLSFLGGTALRIVHGNARFSEDIDLDNFGLSWQAFGDMIQKVRRFLELEGFEVELNQVSSEAFHCYLRFPDLLYAQGLSPHQQEKILIQVDTAAQGYAYEPQLMVLNKFDVFTQIRVTPLDVLLSQKIFTAVNRKRAKGRDFYDITFLFGRTKPDFAFLEQKMGIRTPGELRESLLHKIEGYDFEALARDVAPFLISQDQVRRVQLFREFWQQVPLE